MILSFVKIIHPVLKLKWIDTEPTSHLFPFEEGIIPKVTNE